MNLRMTSRFDQDDFQCPGEPTRIGRAVHLARLTDGYPACCECPHRGDTEGLTERSRKKIPAKQGSRRPADFRDAEGVAGNLHEGFDPALAGRFAAGFGIVMRDEVDATGAYPTVAIAGDGRPVTQRHFAEAAQQLRWAGCDVVDLGTVPCPALPWAIRELEADGGLYLGNSQGDPHRAGIHFYGRSGRPVTEAASFEAICAWAEKEPDRPVRAFGKAGKFDAMHGYGSRFAASFHGLRPLRFVLHTTCRPLGACVERLLQKTACKMMLRESETRLPSEPLTEAVGHFAAAVDDDGRRCRVWDERGEPVPFDRLLLLLARIVSGRETRRQPIVVDEDLPAAISSVLQRRGFQVGRCGHLPSEIHTAMAGSGAALGADGQGRLWYGEPDGQVIADALGTLTLLLGKLSEGDRSLSEVLDAEAGAH
jgi:phosphomannomutase